ncbi:hypothetical protein [Streptomonospora wellingtoniae]|uniref:DUF11 domain-containing protein n=1 Tax=Streptomonospora wellingtoniae TaxID=3075544 RepID=A0ABU2KP82_9ACTN|nr:hypothetical protein [Streptomonospora sp. DSM 45055]MDT0301012.1 hypothetical protein [Streptomonospora sp. DSM 45055]
MTDGNGSLARRCAAGAITAALAAAAAAAAGAATVPPEEGGAAPAAGAVWSGTPASAAFAPGAPPSVVAALAPADPAERGAGERTATVEGTTLAVHITDDRDTIAAGEEVLYTLTLRNEGDEGRRAIVSQRLSPRARFVDVEADGTARGGVATWRVVVEPGAEVERTARVRLGEPGERLWRVATTACAQAEAGAPPVACATDADRVDGSVREAASAVSAPQRVLTITSVLTAVLLVLATGVAAFVVWTRLRPDGRRDPVNGDDG